MTSREAPKMIAARACYRLADEYAKAGDQQQADEYRRIGDRISGRGGEGSAARDDPRSAPRPR